MINSVLTRGVTVQAHELVGAVTKDMYTAPFPLK